MPMSARPLTLSNTYVFWENNNPNITGTAAISYTNVQTIGVTNNDPRLFAATNPIVWFYGWTPVLLPYITNQPIGQTVSATKSASFTVGAAGIPDPTYQWSQNGTPISGATAATYNITNAMRTNGGNYSVVVSKRLWKRDEPGGRVNLFQHSARGRAGQLYPQRRGLSVEHQYQQPAEQRH